MLFRLELLATLNTAYTAYYVECILNNKLTVLMNYHCMSISIRNTAKSRLPVKYLYLFVSSPDGNTTSKLHARMQHAFLPDQENG